MPVKIRHLKNQRRGTELTYATIPIEEAKNGLNEKEVLDYMIQSYGPKISTKGFFEYVRGGFLREVSLNEAISLFAKNPKVTRAQFYTRNSEPSEVEVINQRYLVFGKAEYLTLEKKGDRILVMPASFLHAITGNKLARKSDEDPYDHLRSILESGLNGTGFANAFRAKYYSRKFPRFDYSFPSEKKG